MEPTEETMLLGAMLNCEMRGDYRTLSGHVIYSGSRLVESEDANVVREFGRLMIRAASAWRHEIKNGEGSLLDHQNEENIKWGVVPPN